MRLKSRGGFTLIEFVVVVVAILGMLAVFAVPRFASVERQARIASRDALAGSVRSTAALAHALWLANGGESAHVVIDGQTIDIENGYPTAVSIAAALADYSGYGFAARGATARFAGARVTTCGVTYTEAVTGGAPTVAVTDPC